MAIIFDQSFTLGENVALVGTTHAGTEWELTNGSSPYGSGADSLYAPAGDGVVFNDGTMPGVNQVGEIEFWAYSDIGQTGFILHNPGVLGNRNGFEFAYTSGSTYIIGYNGGFSHVDGPDAASINLGALNKLRGIVAWTGATHNLTIKLNGTTISTSQYAGLTDAGKLALHLVGTTAITPAFTGLQIKRVRVAENEADLDEAPPEEEEEYAVTNPLIYHNLAGYDVADDGLSMQTGNEGTPIRVKFTGYSGMKIDTPTALLSALGYGATDYPLIGWRGFCSDKTVISGSALLASGMTEMTIASGLDTAKTYEFEVYIETFPSITTGHAWTGGYDVPYRWRIGPNIRLTGTGGTLLQATVRPLQAIQFCDSTGLSLGTNGTNLSHLGADARKGWVMAGAEGENADVVNASVGSSGWGYGTGAIPSVLTLWKLTSAGRPRDCSGLGEMRFRLGENDQDFSPTSDAVVAANMETLVDDIRTDTTTGVAADVLITIEIPFGRGKSAIITATAEALMASDDNIRLVDNGPIAAIGTDGEPVDDISDDGTHFNLGGHRRAAIFTAADHVRGETITIEPDPLPNIGY
jgi:hypothetical protein